MTFRGCGLSGPLSRCPEVKYNHPSHKPVRVVFTRKGSFPITDQVNESRSNLKISPTRIILLVIGCFSVVPPVMMTELFASTQAHSI
uniref:Uncharacterized protein n=1 Tax=Rhizophora mucronata TaxID=61149 RepID=A0A2P2NTI7_RHIMU